MNAHAIGVRITNGACCRIRPGPTLVQTAHASGNTSQASTERIDRIGGGEGIRTLGLLGMSQAR